MVRQTAWLQEIHDFPLIAMTSLPVPPSNGLSSSLPHRVITIWSHHLVEASVEAQRCTILHVLSNALSLRASCSIGVVNDKQVRAHTRIAVQHSAKYSPPCLLAVTALSYSFRLVSGNMSLYCGSSIRSRTYVQNAPCSIVWLDDLELRIAPQKPCRHQETSKLRLRMTRWHVDDQPTTAHLF